MRNELIDFINFNYISSSTASTSTVWTIDYNYPPTSLTPYVFYVSDEITNGNTTTLNLCYSVDEDCDVSFSDEIRRQLQFNWHWDVVGDWTMDNTHEHYFTYAISNP